MSRETSSVSTPISRVLPAIGHPHVFSIAREHGIGVASGTLHHGLGADAAVTESLDILADESDYLQIAGESADWTPFLLHKHAKMGIVAVERVRCHGSPHRQDATDRRIA